MTRLASLGLAILGSMWVLDGEPASAAQIRKDSVWSVSDIRPGMKGYGLTVLRGTKPERFSVDVLGVLKDSSPGQDVILVRLAGLALEKTGVISGMSGSPVYIDEKLVGAVAYTWSFGTEPLAGITPFVQMVDFSDPSRRHVEWVARSSARDALRMVSLQDDLGWSSAEPLQSAGSPDLVRIQTPVIAGGMSRIAIERLKDCLSPFDLVPVQGGGVAADVAAKVADEGVEPGSAVGVGLVTGDLSLTAIGTVTAVVDDRLFAFGHPFFGMGQCDLPLLSAYIHAVIPRQTVSAKVGSPVRCLGRFDADVSTCIAGRLGGAADMFPMEIGIRTGEGAIPRTFKCQVVRDRSLVGPLTMTLLGSCVTLEGNVPIDLTARLQAKVEVEGYPPLILDDLFSGTRYSGPRGIMLVYAPVSNLVSVLANNPFRPARIVSVSCTTELTDRRRAANIRNVEVVGGAIRAGERLRLRVYIEPERASEDAPTEGMTVIPMELAIPEETAPGTYSAIVCDANADLRQELRRRQHLASPRDFDQLYRLLAFQLAIRRTDLVLRMDGDRDGVAVAGIEFPQLPAAVATSLSSDTSQPVSRFRESLIETKTTPWVVEGFERIRFEVTRKKDTFE